MTNKEIILNFYRDVWNAHSTEKVPQYVREDYIQHNPTVAQGRAGLLEFLPKFFLQEAKHDIQLAIAEDDKVAVYVHVAFNSGNSAKVVDIYRLENGMICEHWDVLQK